MHILQKLHLQKYERAVREAKKAMMEIFANLVYVAP